jgi:hypothetical protein
VKDNETCTPTVKETLMFYEDVQMLKKFDRDFLTPGFAQPRIPHDILFAIGGVGDGSLADCIEAYDVRADWWIKVSSIQIC